MSKTQKSLETMTGMQVSLDGGVTWKNTGNVRVMFRDANEDDDGFQDLLVNVTHEGIILDVIAQESGEVDKTTCMMVEDLIGMAH